MKEKRKRRLGDRKDATLIRDIDAMHFVMGNVYINRTDNEAYISETIETAPLLKWIEGHKDEELKYTMFHLIVAASLKLLVVKPKLNRFISNRNYYQRNETAASFVVKRQFTEEAKEGMAVVRAEKDDTVFTIHEKIKKQIIPCKQGKNSHTENDMDLFLKMPRFLSRAILDIVRKWDERGWLPLSMLEGDANHTSVFITNLGSIGLNCGYHHLSNYGNSSIFLVIGKKHMAPFYDEVGNVTMKEVIDLGLTVDERIADGYYYAQSVKILKKLLENPELLEKPFEEEVTL